MTKDFIDILDEYIKEQEEKGSYLYPVRILCGKCPDDYDGALPDNNIAFLCECYRRLNELL